MSITLNIHHLSHRARKLPAAPPQTLVSTGCVISGQKPDCSLMFMIGREMGIRVVGREGLEDDEHWRKKLQKPK